FRRAQPCLGVRLHQRLVDAEGRSRLRICLPALEPDGAQGLSAVHAAQCRSDAPRRAVGQLLLGLYPARPAASAQAGLEAAMETLPELRARPVDPALRKAARPGDDVRAIGRRRRKAGWRKAGEAANIVA